MDLGLKAWNWNQLLDERQNKEINLAVVYSSEFSHGTDGHNRLLLIARLARILSVIEDSGVDINALFKEE